jgi:pimeloyl-ACP methyl ester carboxylesterase
MANTTPQTGYAPVHSLNMYYEIHGAGRPLVLLHGAMGTIGMFVELLPSLAKTHQVIAIEQQAHGRTADIDRPLRYEQMADDTAAALRHLNIDNADVFGYSLGGGIALQLAIRHPDLVRKLVVASATYNNDGLYPEVLATHAKGAGSLGFGGAMLDGLNDLLPEIFGVGIHPTTIPRGPTPLQDALVPC